MNKDSKIYIVGHRGSAGSAIMEKLQKLGYNNLIYATREELNLLDFSVVKNFFDNNQPEYVFFAAAKMSALGVKAPADILYENLTIQNNIFFNSYSSNVKKLIFFGSSWMYPQHADNPIKEESLLTSELEYNAEPYALAKIAGVRMCEFYNLQYNTNFISVALTNLYGKTADYNLKTARVLPAMLRKFHLAKLLNEKRYDEILLDLNLQDQDEAISYLNTNGIHEEHIELWGTGKTRREFIHSDDLADVCIYIMNNINFSELSKNNIKNTHVNVGTGSDLSIAELAYLIKQITQYQGEIKFDISKPDSSMNRLLDCSKIHSLGWKHKIELEEGIKMMYEDYLQNNKRGTGVK
ncbi:TPA: NAD-dependent epimerase/dehydratase family protein [Campylobacter jejuni]|nr:NAD-dependent epimerase/dehydratase family protein [Campylobacter jejuni]HED1137192.1 NAD-dependent epimerase/dehydratase family protein [Campylobacter jejuni]